MSTETLPAPIALRPSVRVVTFRPMAKGSLRALVDIELVRIGLIFKNCGWFRNPDGREWVGLPSQRFEGSDGVVRFTPLVEFAPSAKEARQKFQEAALSAIHRVAAVDETAR